MSTSELNLFPTYSSLVLDAQAPSPLLPTLDRAGCDAVRQFDAVLTTAGVAISEPQAANPETLRAACAAFERVLWDRADVPRATRRLVARSLPNAWDRITTDARAERFSAALLLLEADARHTSRVDHEAAQADEHPVTAYLDRLGQDAARTAFAAHAAELKSGADDATAQHAAEDAFFDALAATAIDDLIGWIRKLDETGFWIVTATGAAGLLASFLIAPRVLLRSAASLGLDPLPISADFDVAVIGGTTKVRIGGGVIAMTGELANAETWQQVFRQGLGARASLALDFGTSKLTARVDVAPATWGLRFGFSGVFA